MSFGMKSLASLVAAAAIGLGASGCAHYRADPSPRPAQPLTEEMRNYYGYKREAIEARLEEEEDLGTYIKRTYTFTCSDPGHIGDQPKFDYFLPKKRPEERSPAMVVTRWLGGSIPDWVPGIFFEEGWPTIMPYRPDRILRPGRGGEELEALFRHSVIDYRKCIDWLCQQPEVDPSRIGSLGISMGAISNIVLAAVDRDETGTPRLKYNAIVMPGEDLHRIMLESTENMVLEYMKDRQQQTGKSLNDISKDIEKHLRSDPKHLAPHIGQEQVLLFIAAFDAVIPPKYAWSLRERLGNPETYTAPTGHYTLLLTQIPYPWLGGKVKSYFHERFDRK
jgi:hypothetical protein